MNERFILRDKESERRFRRAMVVRAQGVPAENERSICLRKWANVVIGVPLVIALAFAFTAVVPALFWTSGLIVGEYRVVAFGILVAGWLVTSLGHRLLLPKDGDYLLTTPVRDSMAWLHSFWRLPFLLFGLWALIVVVFLFANSIARSDLGASYTPIEILLVATGWMALPMAGLAWQFFRRGRAGPILLWIGVCILSFTFLMPLVGFFFNEQTVEELWKLDENRRFLPTTWLLGNSLGYIAVLACFGLAIGSWIRAQSRFRLRATQAGKIQLAPAPEEKSSESEAESVVPSAQVGSSGRFVSSLFALFWTRAEKETALVLGYRAKVRELVKPLIAFGLLGLLWMFSFDPMLQATLPIPITPIGIFLLMTIWLLLLRGWKSQVAAMAFRKFSAGGSRNVMVLGAVPVSEPQVFRMFWKEWLVSRFLNVSVQCFALFVLLTLPGIDIGMREWAIALVVVIASLTCNSATVWAGLLWRGMELFPNTFLGKIKEQSCTLGYAIPLVVFSVMVIWSGSAWLFDEKEPTGFILSSGFLIGWKVGVCWLMRWLYACGKGSLLVMPTKRKSFTLTFK